MAEMKLPVSQSALEKQKELSLVSNLMRTMHVGFALLSTPSASSKSSILFTLRLLSPQS